MAIKNIFFDCFGTLVHFNKEYGQKQSDGHFVPSSYNAVWQILKENNFNKSLAEVSCALKSSWRRCEEQYTDYFYEISSFKRFGYFLDFLKIKPIDELVYACMKAHSTYMMKSTMIDNDLITSLRKLQKCYNLSILSNFNCQISLEKIIAFHQLENFFDKILSSEFLGYRKPSKTFFDKAFEEVEFKYGETIYIGDSLHYDASGAMNANLPFVIVGKDGELTNYSKVNKISELYSYLKKNY